MQDFYLFQSHTTCQNKLTKNNNLEIIVPLYYSRLWTFFSDRVRQNALKVLW